MKRQGRAGWTVSDFHFVGQLPASKSLLNRTLILQDYFKDLKIRGDSQCDDVVFMKKGLASLKVFSPIDCGEAGTVLRFLALRASRVPGEHVLLGSQRLLARPQQDLVRVLRQLGMEVEQGENSLKIKSQGWKVMGDSLHIHSEKSSQFASAVLLNAWGHSQALHFSLSRQMVSSSYWKMTLKLVQSLGLKVESWGNDYRVPPHQCLRPQEYWLEPDADCSFALAALAAVSGTAHINSYPRKSLQPDYTFVDVLRQMNVSVNSDNRGNLRVKKASRLKAVEYNVGQYPDLFPVLSALCARAEGVSRLYGARHLKYKESNRIVKMSELLRNSGCDVEVLDDGLIIERNFQTIKEFDFDTDHDHRLAMAAGVLKKAGIPINIIHPEVVSKSFPSYWELAGL